MPLKTPFAPFFVAIAIAAAISIAYSPGVRAQATTEDSAKTKASPAEVKENNAVVKEITAKEKTVESKDGAKHAETGQAKPTETWLAACPPGDAKNSDEINDCKKPGDGATKPVAK